LSDKERKGPPSYKPIDLVDRGYEFYNRLRDSYETGKPLGPQVTFSHKLAREICGALPDGLTIMHGPPGCGKSALVQQIAAQAGCPVLYVTFEMSADELMRRNAARVTNTYISKFRTGELTRDTWLSYMRRGARDMSDVLVLDGTSERVELEDVRDQINSMRGDSEHLLVVIDSVSAWVRISGGDRTEYEAINFYLTQLARLGKEYKCAVLAVGEQNRSNRDSARQEAAAGSRTFEYGCEIMFALSRDQEQEPDAEECIDICLTLAKNRLGAQGRKVALRFNGGFMKFTEAEDDTKALEMVSRNKRRRKEAA
jgi:replicative DNA helicase